MIAALVESVQTYATRVALELQWDLREDDDDRCSWELELHVIVEAPGPKHSRYSTFRIHAFPAEELEERREAHRIARIVAERTRLALHAPPVEDRGGQGDSGFLRAAPAGDPVGYPVDWEAAWWTTDGRRHVAAGSERVEAASGDAAERDLERRLLRWPFRPLSIQTNRRGGTRYNADPPGTPDTRALRLAAREAHRASVVARRFPDASPLALMMGFADAFRLWLERLEPLSRWRAGEIDDSTLDAAVDLSDDPGAWERPLVLEERWQAGQSIAAYLREVRAEVPNRLALIRDLREVFDLGLADAERFVDAALHGLTPDAELDASLVRR